MTFSVLLYSGLRLSSKVTDFQILRVDTTTGRCTARTECSEGVEIAGLRPRYKAVLASDS